MIIGWREWLSLPDLGVPRIKAKIDTGARSSSLHAYDIEQFQREGCSLVRFKVHPIQRREQMEVCCVAEVHDIRSVRSSSGEATDRIVIQTTASWLDQEWTIDLTLADRSQMGFACWSDVRRCVDACWSTREDPILGVGPSEKRNPTTPEAVNSHSTEILR